MNSYACVGMVPEFFSECPKVFGDLRFLYTALSSGKTGCSPGKAG